MSEFQKIYLSFLITLILAIVILGGFNARDILFNDRVLNTNTTEQQSEFGEIQKVEDETENWQTYRNEEFGFEVKYPEELPIFQSANHGSQVIVAVKNADTFGIFIDRNSTIEDRLAVERKIFSEYKIDEATTQFAGQSAIQLDINNSEGFTNVVLVQHPYIDSVIIAIHRSGYFGEDIEERILSTFKFIE